MILNARNMLGSFTSANQIFVSLPLARTKIIALLGLPARKLECV
jgi:hypothetical protein